MSDAVQVVSGLRRSFKDCYDRFLARTVARGPSQAQLSFHVDCEGRVSGIHATVHNLDREAVDCLFATGASAHFAEPVTGASLVQLPIRFEPAAGGK